VAVEELLACLQRGDTGKAIELAQTALRGDPNNPELYELLGIASYQAGRLQSACESFRRLTQLSPQDAHAHNNYGQLLLELGDLDNAYQSSQRALQIDPQLHNAYNTLGNIQRAQRQLTQAADSYAKATALHADPMYLCNLGVVEGELERYPEALAHLAHAIALAPDFLPAIGIHAAILQKLGRYEEAAQAYQEVLTLEPEQPETINNLGTCLKQMGEVDRARTQFEYVLRLAPEHVGAHVNLALIAEDNDDLKEALQFYDKALMLAPADPLIRSNMGALFLRLGRTADAFAAFTAALKTEPDYGRALAGLADTWLEKGVPDKAQQSLARALQLLPKDSYVHEVDARMQEALGNNAAAEAAYQRALALSEQKHSVHYSLAQFYTRTGEYDLAEAQYRQITSDQYPDVILNWAAMEEKRNRPEQAAALITRAREILGRDTAPLLLIASRISFRNQEYATALQQINKIDLAQIDSLSLQKDCLFHKGKVLDKLDRFDEAFAAFTQANKLRQMMLARDQRAKPSAPYAGYEVIFKAVKAPANVTTPVPTPIFIVGFPRSGTTLVEQILSCHPEVVAGDELPYVLDLAGGVATNLLGGSHAYPECLLNLTSENSIKLQNYYLDRAEHLLSGTHRFFTDKMPLNLTQLGLIYLMFPGAPIIHVIRHPLDACLSCYAANFSRLSFSASLQETARHYIRAIELAEYYKQKFPLRYLELRYEDLINDQETHTRTLLDFVGLQWDARCLKFYDSPRVARTESYEQVTRAIYNSSQYRYRPYLSHLQSIVPVLQPTIERLGYVIEAS